MSAYALAGQANPNMDGGSLSSVPNIDSGPQATLTCSVDRLVLKTFTE